LPLGRRAASKGKRGVGTSQEDRDKHHARIVAVAARRVREKGLDGISIADLMKDAGLTHGGFYRHFGSREDLIGDAVECALGEWTQQRAKRDPKPPAKRFHAAVDDYLSINHRNSPGSGCAVAALSSEAWRGGKRVRQAYIRQVKLYLSLLEGVLDGRRRQVARRASILALSALVGAVGMARSVDDDQLSLEILNGTAEALKFRLARV
jgi:TetR/AcrR family transcriptional regulator, transcriptional repressor for nem operon